MRSFDISIENGDLIYVLEQQKLERLVILRHGDQPASLLFWATSESDWIQFAVEMEPIADREEVGRIAISRTRPRSRDDLDIQLPWKYCDIQIPSWMHKKRNLEILRASLGACSVDVGVRIFNSSGELNLRASSFPTCIEIGITATDFEISDNDTEFPKASLKSRPFMIE